MVSCYVIDTNKRVYGFPNCFISSKQFHLVVCPGVFSVFWQCLDIIIYHQNNYPVLGFRSKKSVHFVLACISLGKEQIIGKTICAVLGMYI